MQPTQHDKAVRFRDLHEGPAFVIPNPFDGASARILGALGFPALATSSGASAGGLGRRDGHITREEAIRHVGLIASVTELPVSGDLEHGFGDTPEDAATTIREAAAVGLVGGSIEDVAPGAAAVYDFDLAVARVAAAVEAARSLDFPFVVTARTQNWLKPDPDLDETIRRLRAFEAVGADVLFAPALPDLAAVKAVCDAVSRPVNFMAGIPGRSFTVAELVDAGVRRISLATSLYRAALVGMATAVREVQEQGTFSYVGTPIPGVDLRNVLL